jgi:hypothetical protein
LIILNPSALSISSLSFLVVDGLSASSMTYLVNVLSAP